MHGRHGQQEARTKHGVLLNEDSEIDVLANMDGNRMIDELWGVAKITLQQYFQTLDEVVNATLREKVSGYALV